MHEENEKYWPEDLKEILGAVGGFLDGASAVEKQAFVDNIRLAKQECQIARLKMLGTLSFPADPRMMKVVLKSRDEFEREVQKCDVI